MFNKISNCEQNTIDIGYNLGKYLHKNDVIVLSGPLGAGKTKFVQGVLKYFKIENEISSPTFTIVNEHVSKNISIFHFDVYRFDSPLDFLNIGGEEYFDRGICIIEWGEKIAEFLPTDYLEIKFSLKDSVRLLEFIPHGEKYKHLISQL